MLEIRSCFLWILGIALVCLLVLGLQILNRPDDHFCTTEDSTYQVIQANTQSWLSEFSFAADSHSDEIHFEVDDRSYTVRASLAPDETRLFYVAVAESWPATPTGLKGYLYTSSGTIPQNYWPPIYHLKPLAGNIYCYDEYSID